VIGIAPMLATDGKASAFPSAGGWLQERKLDGWRFLFVRTETGVRCYCSRNMTERTGELPEIESRLLYLPIGSVLDAEVVVPGKPSPAVATALARKTGMVAHVFDILRVGPADTMRMALSGRRELLEQAAIGFDGELIRISPVYEPSEARHQAWTEKGYEGSVLKRWASIYEPGKRSRNWIKHKPQRLVEGMITGLERGKGSWSDGYGKFLIRLLDSGVDTSCAIPTKSMRADVTRDPEKYLLRVCDLRVTAVFASGSPRHLIFDKLRLDR
jgi:bifunctional non-homologous end joining protein LigD